MRSAASKTTPGGGRMRQRPPREPCLRPRTQYGLSWHWPGPSHRRGGDGSRSSSPAAARRASSSSRSRFCSARPARRIAAPFFPHVCGRCFPMHARQFASASASSFSRAFSSSESESLP